MKLKSKQPLRSVLRALALSLTLGAATPTVITGYLTNDELTKKLHLLDSEELKKDLENQLSLGMLYLDGNMYGDYIVGIDLFRQHLTLETKDGFIHHDNIQSLNLENLELDYLYVQNQIWDEIPYGSLDEDTLELITNAYENAPEIPFNISNVSVKNKFRIFNMLDESLQEIDLSSCKTIWLDVVHLSENDINTILKNCNNLQELYINNYSGFCRELKLNLPTLKTLFIEGSRTL